MINVIELIHGLNTGGAETVVKNYALGLPKDKFRVTVLTYEKFDSPYEKELAAAGIDIIYISDKMPFYGKSGIVARIANIIGRRILIRKYIRKVKPQIIHMHLRVNKYVKFTRPSKKTVLFYTQHHDFDDWISKYPEDTKAMKYLLNNYRYYPIAINENMRNQMNKYFSIDSTRLIRNSVDIEKYLCGMNKEESRENLGIHKNAFVIGHIGRFSKVKNHRFILEVFSEILKKKENSILLLVGNGSEEENIISYAKELNVYNRLKFIKGRIDTENIIKSMDVFIFPSLNEGLGISIIEAQLAGLPCVASDRVPSDTKISNLIKYISLKKNAKYWADEVLNINKDKKIEYNEDYLQWDNKYVSNEIAGIYIKSLKNFT